jgi:tryptophanyl-tRNA synthetase
VTGLVWGPGRINDRPGPRDDAKMKNTTDDNVKLYSEELLRLGIEHQAREHESLVKAADVQKALGDDLSGSMPTLIMKAGDRFVAVVKRDNTKLDSGKLKKALGVSNLRMATAEEFEQVTGVSAGAARVYTPGLPTYLDKAIFEKEYLNGGTGSFSVTFKYKTEDLKKIPGAEIIDVTEKTSNKKIIFAGMRPTGRLHLGNYLGSAKGMMALQANPDYETTFMVVDLHGVTTPYDRLTYRDGVRNVMLDYLAIGLDPEKSVLTVQSLVPEHIELAYLFSSVTTIAKMTHLPTFKEKVKQYPEHSTMALLNYPVLMAADILVYKAELVPVGIDQEPHLEVTREIARRMNQEYGTDFPEPVRFATKGGYVPSLTGEGKMSKTVEGSYINLTDDRQTIAGKVARMPTDAGGPGDPAKAGQAVANVFKFVELFTPEKLEYYAEEYRNGRLKYAQVKEDLSRAIYDEIRPIQERRREIEARPGYLEKVIKEGAEKAHIKAKKTLDEVREKMGLYAR